MNSVSPPKSKSDLPTRTAAAIVMIAVAVTAIYLGGWPFRILVGVAAALMLIEYCDMHKLRRTWPIIGMLLLAINLWLIPEFALRTGGAEEAGPFWAILGATAGFALLLAAISRTVRLGIGYLYIAIPTLALLALNQIGWEIVFWTMIVTWATDIFAYFAGRSVGGPKLAPKISPNKTWAGLIGGMAGAGLLGAAVAWAFDLGSLFILAGAPMGLLAQLGDLYESAMKRKAGVKDSGTILPGHGGVLDRLDGLLPVCVATLALAWIGL
ncbi:MAG: phosphatidate cytidylyltransferase [Sphingosinicella sp.]|nr:phosphatidate cytidylyltransferase [Sphingosinicella sp.]